MSLATTSTWLRSRAATVSVLLLVLGGCSDTTGDGRPEAGASDVTATEPPPPGDGITVLRPGEPGEPAETVGPDAVPHAPEATRSDIAFVQLMVPHHAQALELTRLAATRASSSSVRALARRIEGAQGPEILELVAWLEAHDVDVRRDGGTAHDDDHGQHGHASMPGMLTDAQVARLAATRGHRFDQLFLEGMIRHHLGAVEMAEAVAVDGADLRISEIAADVATGQRAEVDRMRDLLRRL